MANFIVLSTIKISQLKSALIKQMIMFSNYKTESERSIKATYEVAKLTFIEFYGKLHCLICNQNLSAKVSFNIAHEYVQ